MSVAEPDSLDAAPDTSDLLEKAAEASALLKALSHESRLAILCLLIEGEKTVGELERKLGRRQPFVSQQLARLRADELVETRRHGTSVYYSVSRPEIIDIVGSLHRTFCVR